MYGLLKLFYLHFCTMIHPNSKIRAHNNGIFAAIFPGLALLSFFRNCFYMYLDLLFNYIYSHYITAYRPATSVRSLITVDIDAEA